MEDYYANRSLGTSGGSKTPKSVEASMSEHLMQSDWPHYWQDDASLSSCLRCSKVFTFFRRRHHCRVCGKIYCDACSSRRVPAKDYGYSDGTKEVRACEQCYKEAAALLTEHERYRIDVDLLSVRARHQKALDELQNKWGLKEHFIREPFKVVDRDLTASMKVFIDSTDGYSTKFGKRSSDIASLLHRLPPDNRQDLLDLHARHLKVVLAQCLQRRDLSLFQWRQKLQEFTETTVWHLATLPKSVFWLASNTKAMNPSMEAREMHSTGRFKVDDGGVLEPFVRVVGLGDGNPDESYCFAGVLFEGNVVNRHMKTTRGHSKVAILDCGLHESALSTVSKSALTSLRSLINNESTVSFAHSLVARIVNLHTDIIFTRDSVSHDAQQLLMMHDITIVANVSKRNLRALAKSTGASILSVAALHNRGIMSRPDRLLGHCLEFEVQLYSLPSEQRLMTSSSNATDDKKSFVRVHGKLKNQFKTWVLRGLTKPELQRMHDVINVALFVSYNAMLEISFVFDCCGAYYDAAETLDSTDEKEILASDRSESISSNHRDSLDDVKRSLSMSHNRYRFMPIESSPFTFSEHACEAMNGPTPAAPVFTLPKLAGPNREAPPPDRQSPLLQSSLRLGHYWLRKVGGGQFVQCMDPKLVALEFYGDHDTTLGRFLHRICFDTSLVCSAPSCLKSMKEHLWCITHGDGKITVEIERLPQPLLKGDVSANPSGDERTLTWLWCRQCRRRTSPVSELSSRTLNWSLGKMLEHFFYDDHVRSRHPSCSHQLNRDMIRTFCRGSSLAIFSYSSSKPFSLRLSKEITIDANLLRSRTYHVLSRLRALLSIVSSASLRATVKNAPALAIDSAVDSQRQTILRQYEWIRQRSFELEQSGSGPLAASQLYLHVFAFAEEWGRHLNVHRTMLPLPRSGRSDALLSWLGTRPIPRCLRSGKWQVVPTFGNAILPIVPKEPSSFVAHALASFQHVAFINGISTVQQMDVAVRNLSLEDGLRPLCLLSNPTMDRDEELSTIRHILSSSTPDHQAGIGSSGSSSSSKMSQITSIGSFSSLWPTHANPGAVLIPCGEFGHVWVTFAKKFHALRQFICGDNYTVVESLANSDKWEAQGGKSSATFSRSWCHRFVLKEISSTEGRTFCRISDDYFDYMKSSLFDDTPSALVPILGLFEVFRKKDGHSQVYLLMSNLLGGLHQRPQLVFDLKGKRHGRYVEESEQPSNATSNTSWRLKRSADTGSGSPELALGRSSAISMDELDVLPAAESYVSRHAQNCEGTTRPDSEQVLLDENFAVYTLGQPLPLAPEQALILQRAFENDSSLLCRLGIMDYSILCGVSEEPERQLVLGIIDYIRAYTLDKKVENKIKTLIERADPTVLPPVDYRLRFLSAAHRYFILAPNRR